RRWTLMIGRSSSRSVVLKAGLRGLSEGLRKAPRSNEQALQGIHQLPDWKLGGQAQSSSNEDFSVLLPVYAGDDAELFRRAVESVSSAQSRLPQEVVIVRDGPVPAAIESFLLECEQKPDGLVRVVRLPQSVGL
ncbi:glycosyl transferase, partial [Vibrio vulnificus]